MGLYILGIFMSLLIIAIGINMYFSNAQLGFKNNIIPVIGVSLGLFFCFVLLSGVYDKLEEENARKEKQEENISTYLIAHYQVNDPDALSIQGLEEKGKYKIELLNGRKDIVRLDISEDNSVNGIEVLDSSEDVKK